MFLTEAGTLIVDTVGVVSYSSLGLESSSQSDVASLLTADYECYEYLTGAGVLGGIDRAVAAGGMAVGGTYAGTGGNTTAAAVAGFTTGAHLSDSVTVAVGETGRVAG